MAWETFNDWAILNGAKISLGGYFRGDNLMAIPE